MKPDRAGLAEGCDGGRGRDRRTGVVANGVAGSAGRAEIGGRGRAPGVAGPSAIGSGGGVAKAAG